MWTCMSALKDACHRIQRQAVRHQLSDGLLHQPPVRIDASLGVLLDGRARKFCLPRFHHIRVIKRVPGHAGIRMGGMRVFVLLEVTD